MVIGHIVTWDGNPSSAIPEIINQKVSRKLVGGVRDEMVNVPGRDGAYLYAERRGNRTISVSGTIVADSPDVRHATVVEMADWLDKTGYRDLIFSDQPDRYWRAAVSDDPDPDEWKSLGKYVLNWTAEPYAWAITTSSECASASGGDAKNFTIPDTIDAYPVVEITARGGNAEDVVLTVNGDDLNYAGDILQNQSITISSLNYTVVAGVNLDLELTGAFTSGTVFPADVTGIFPVLVEGLNTWRVTWGAGTATYVDVCFYWRRRYR